MSPRVDWDGITARLEALRSSRAKPSLILLKDEEILGPTGARAALECAYCGRVMIVDFLQWNGECPRCGGYATIDEIAQALFITDQRKPQPDRFPDPRTFLFGGATGSVASLQDQIDAWAVTGSLHDMRLLIPEPQVCRIDGHQPAVGDSGLCEHHGGGWLYEGLLPITADNYLQIELEHGKSIERLIIEEGHAWLTRWRA